MSPSRSAALEVLRRALIEGEQSGLPRPFDFAAFIAEMRNAGARCRSPLIPPHKGEGDDETEAYRQAALPHRSAFFPCGRR
jgi:hypothetical protein